MRERNPASIADPHAAAHGARLVWIVFAAALVGLAAAAVFYAERDLTLSHYDARAHLVVSRRVFDSLTPGWRQLGGVWLPLPHLLGLPAVAWDQGYQTGYGSVAVSVVIFAWGLSALASFLWRRTGSAAAAIVGPVLIGSNPNVLYLASTPMTEPLLIGFSLIALDAVDRWTATETVWTRRVASSSLAALVLTRYEGWLIAAALVALGAAATRARGFRRALALVPAASGAVGLFVLLSWGSTGQWLVTGGFFERDARTFGDVWASVSQIGESTQLLGGWWLITVALGGAAAMAALPRPHASSLWLLLALVAAAGLPAYAFFEGHPHRVRYMVPLVVALGALGALAVTWVPQRRQIAAALIVLGGALWERPPFDASAPMVTEAQWETPFRRGRQAVTNYLAAEHDGSPILASMGSLGHYMQEAAGAGIRIRDFIHEGNGDLWLASVADPGSYVQWVLVEERAEGGDQLHRRRSARPDYLVRFSRVASGGGLALYRRNAN